MRMNGVITKSILCLLIVVAAGAAMWELSDLGWHMKWFTIGSMIVALIACVSISYFQRWVAPLTILYSVAKGVFLGSVSIYFKNNATELLVQAAMLTVLAFLVMFALYAFRIIKVTKLVRSIIINAAMTIFVLYFGNWLLDLFFDYSLPFITGNGWWAIGFNVVAAVVASFTLLLDFDFVERNVGVAPQIKEWNATFGLLVSILWMYWELVRLLQKLATRR